MARPPDYRPTDYPVVDGFGDYGRDFSYDSGQCGSHVSSMALHLPTDGDPDQDDDD